MEQTALILPGGDTNQILPQQDLVCPDPYAGVGTLRLSEKAVAVFLEPVNPEDVNIRPDGISYLPGVMFRNRLNKALGPGAWGIKPIRAFMDDGDKILYYHGALIIQGTYVTEAIGEVHYYARNPMQSYAAAHEAAKTDCIGRCCKDLGIGAELFDKIWVERWRAKYAIQVWTVHVKRDANVGEVSKFWRRKDALPFEYPDKEMSKEEVTAHFNSKKSPQQNKPTTENAGQTAQPAKPPQQEKPAEPSFADKCALATVWLKKRNRLDVMADLCSSHNVATYNDVQDRPKFEADLLAAMTKIREEEKNVK